MSKSSNKAWKKKEYVLETQEQYPRKVCFQLFNDKVDQFPLQVGQDVKVGIDIESREYNGRWYTQVSAYNVEILSAPRQETSQGDDPNGLTGMQPTQAANIQKQESDDMPF
ncbi:MAG: DUF3127 domain-containing protein [Lachnospiraceae bacterium]|nr:DUF3127 domain-containing protein [Lachnospiraceae bacterium]